jgi:hypothetical protein
MMRFSLYGAAIALALVAPGRAATFDMGALGDTDGQWISVEGQIGPDDFAAFKLKANRLTARKIAVMLSGPGGNLIAAIQIGEFVRLKGWGTFVFSECDSACAAIWLAGTPRMVAPNALVGFHAASINGQENGTGNALFGAYMTRLGLGYEAVGWATTAGPRDISYLTPAKAKEIGIDLNVLEIDANQANAQPAVPPTQPSAPGLRRERQTFVVPPQGTINAGRNCSGASQEIRDFFPQFFADCDPKTVKTTPTFAYNFVTKKVWDRYVQSSGRYVTRTLQACEGCAGAPSDSLQSQRNVYRLIAKMNGVNGEPPDGSVCWFTPQGWSDCENTAGEHYRLQAGSIRSFVGIALGVAEP